MRVIGRIGERLRAALVFQRPFGVVPRTVEREKICVLDQQRVEAAKELVVLDHMVVGTDVRELARFSEIPMVEIEAAAGLGSSSAGNREGRSRGRMKQSGRSRVQIRSTLTPVARLASFEKSKDREVALRDRRHRDR